MRRREGREAQEGGDVCIIMADLHLLYGKKQHDIVIFLQLKNKFKKFVCILSVSSHCHYPKQVGYLLTFYILRKVPENGNLFINTC